MTMQLAIRCVNVALILVLVLLVRKLVWCLRWLWCYYHGKEVPDPIGWLPTQSGRVFDGHLPEEEKEAPDDEG